jgi:hypothetical protein
MVIESPPAPDLVIAELKWGARMRQQFAEVLLLLGKRPRADGFAIEVQKVEQEKDQGFGVALVGRGLDQAERSRAVGPHTAQFPIEIGLSGRERRNRRGDRRVLMRPVEPGAGQQPDRATVLAVEFDFVQPLRPFGRVVDQFGELRFDPAGERRRFGAPTSGERSCHVLDTITREHAPLRQRRVCH